MNRVDAGTLAIIAETWTESEASVIQSLLESYDIPCICKSRFSRRVYPLGSESLGQIRIYVPHSLADAALEILQDHRRPYVHLRLVDPEDAL